MSLKAILLAGGKGKRMRTTKAKVLHQLLGYPMIKYILRAVEDCGIKDIIIATGYQA
jgi:bifunctional UDP-N-acetylglucosamine pyrophosphorylase/glucosamine-1-phosphate N-acetyltransferase